MRCREKEDVAHDARVGSQRVCLHRLAQYCSSVSWPKGNKRESAALVFSWQLAEARRRSCAGMGECLVRDGGEGWRPRRDGRDVGGEGLLGACRPTSEMRGETGWQYLRVGFASPWRVVRDGAVRLARHGLEDSCGMRGEGCRPVREGRGAEGGAVLLGASRPSSGMEGGGGWGSCESPLRRQGVSCATARSV